ncbi:unnamed protein product, partial [Mesorhabditis spiculigera]
MRWRSCWTLILISIFLCVEGEEAEKSLTLTELLRLEPGARLLAENLTIILPQKKFANGTARTKSRVFSVQNLNVTSDVRGQIFELFDEPRFFKQSRERWLMYNFYEKCIDREAQERLKSKPLFDMLRLKNPRSPVTVFNRLPDLQLPSHAIFRCGRGAGLVQLDAKRVEHRPQPPLLNYQYYTAPIFESQLGEARTFFKKIFQLLADDDEQGEFIHADGINRSVANFFYVDKKLAEISSRFNADNKTDLTVRLDELSDSINTINFTRYFRAIVPKDMAEVVDIDAYPVRIENYGAVKLVDEFLAGIPNQTLLDYQEGKLILGMLPFLDQRFRDAYNEFNLRIYGVVTEENVEADCLSEATQIFQDLASVIYIEHKFSQKIVDEANAITNFIGFNPIIFNQTATAEKYETLDYSSSQTLLQITQAIARWNADRNFRQLLRTNANDSFDFLASETNAYYDPNLNMMALLAGILQSPFYDITFPRIQNYGSIGLVIGHELTHGFDNYGSQFDEKGNKKNWWDATTLKNYEQTKKCFIEQYGNVTVEPLEMKIDGYKTLGENIADNGGLRAALRAAEKLVRAGQVEPQKIPPELKKYSPIQIFFMSSAYAWCGNWRNETLLTDLVEDVHSPAAARVNIVLGNAPEFAVAFGCPNNSPMVNKKQCRLW